MLKMLGCFLLLLGCAILIIIAVLPSLSSTEWGKARLVALINAAIPGKIETNTIQIRWFGPQSVEGVVLKDLKEEPILSIKSASSEASLFSLWWNRGAGSSFDLSDLNAVLTTDSSGKTNFERALNKNCCQTAGSEKVPIAISLKNVQGSLHWGTKTLPSRLSFQGETQQGNTNGNFHIDAEMKGLSADQLRQTTDLAALIAAEPDAVLSVKAQIAAFPVELIDQMMSFNKPQMSGMLRQLLGDELDLQIQQMATNKGLTLALHATSANFTASLEGILTQEFVLTQPAAFTLKLTPAVVDQWANINNLPPVWKLQTPTTATLKFNQLQFPLALLENKSTLDLSAVKVAADFEVQPATFNVMDPPAQVAFQRFQSTLSSQAGEPIATAIINADATHDGQPMHVDMAITLPKKVIKWDDFFQEFVSQMAFESKVLGFPLSLLNSGESHDFLINAIGPTADLAFTWKPADEIVLATFAMKSAHIELPYLAFAYGKQLTLQQPAQLTLNLQPELVQQFLALHPALAASRLEQITAINLQIGRLEMPLSPTEWRPENISLEGQLVTGPFSMINLPALGSINVKEIFINLATNASHPSQLSFKASLAPSNEAGGLQELLGKNSALSATTSLSFNSQSFPEIEQFQLELTSDLARANITGKMQGQHLLLTAPANISYLFTSAGLQNLGLLSDQYLIDHKTPLEFIVAASPMPLNWKNLSSWQLSGEFKLGELLLSHRLQPNTPLATIDHLKAIWSIDGLKKLINLSYTGVPRLGHEAAGKLSGNVSFSNWTKDSRLDFTQVVIQAHTNVEQLPTELVGVLTGRPELLLLVGNAINGQLAADLSLASSRPQGTFSLSLNCPHLKGSTSLILDQAVRLNGSEPTEFQWQLTPAAFASLYPRLSQNQSSDFALNESAMVNLKVDSLHLPLPLDDNFNLPAMGLNIDANIKALPLSLLCPLICTDPLRSRQIEALIGTTFNAKIKAQLSRLNGLLYLDLKGTNGHMLLDGQIVNGLLTLRNDLTAQVTVTPEVSQYVIQDILPIANGMLNAEQPLKLTLAREGFALPIHQPDISNISVGLGTLDLGKVHFTRQSRLAKVLSLLTNSDDSLRVWFTPAYFSINNGAVSLNRVDLLINESYPLAAWGNVDIPGDQVDMVIGLSGSSISKAFSVPGIPTSYMLQLPLKGSLNDASIDKRKAAARVSAIVAQSQGGPQGLVFGTVLNIASGGLTESPPPKPTTNPLPWSTMLQDQDKEQTGSSEAPENPIQDSVKEIRKGAKSLIKKLFR